ncbi:hypothetical protein [Croceicoccus gelatinilyticus]|uniref:hypothetical protein n=1 Tax=Croceicoccus gelatinilyticus TaxID=2835536 RepID=UPI001BCBBE10|nr:hypothetical protein [Croceicoccus gelatinilyticus]MBS7670672.1 hypothetical protein [Croceicoccus gelatinilyticus]
MAVIAVLVALSVAGMVLRFGMGFSKGLGAIALIDLNSETNFPTYFSVALLACCSLLLALIGIAHRQLRMGWHRHWIFLALVFLAMSMDEFIQLHEKTMEFISGHLGIVPGSILTNSWVVLAFVFLPLLGLAYLRFLMAMNRRSAALMVAAGIVYVGGAVGVEMVSGMMKGTYGFGSLPFMISTTIEETLELVGLAIFIYALTNYAARMGLSWSFEPA